MSALLLFALGCTADTPLPASVPAGDADTDTDTDSDTDVDTDTDVADTDTDLLVDSGVAEGLVGTIPPSPLPLPTFAATNFDGTSRGPDALQGHLTVMWFLPAANTGG